MSDEIRSLLEELRDKKILIEREDPERSGNLPAISRLDSLAQRHRVPATVSSMYSTKENDHDIIKLLKDINRKNKRARRISSILVKEHSGFLGKLTSMLLGGEVRVYTLCDEYLEIHTTINNRTNRVIGYVRNEFLNPISERFTDIREDLKKALFSLLHYRNEEIEEIEKDLERYEKGMRDSEERIKSGTVENIILELTKEALYEDGYISRRDQLLKEHHHVNQSKERIVDTFYHAALLYQQREMFITSDRILEGLYNKSVSAAEVMTDVIRGYKGQSLLRSVSQNIAGLLESATAINGEIATRNMRGLEEIKSIDYRTKRLSRRELRRHLFGN